METQASAGRLAGAKVRVAAPTVTLPPSAAFMSTAPAGGPRAPRASKDWVGEVSVAVAWAADDAAGEVAASVPGARPAAPPVVPVAAVPAVPVSRAGSVGATGSSEAAGATVPLGLSGATAVSLVAKPVVTGTIDAVASGAAKETAGVVASAASRMTCALTARAADGTGGGGGGGGGGAEKN